jgi:hypothetical protein
MFGTVDTRINHPLDEFSLQNPLSAEWIKKSYALFYTIFMIRKKKI